jgi:thiol-disulfide isomerase/thioredoxin
MNSPVIIELDHHSVLLGWSQVADAIKYELEMSTDLSSEENWKSLSANIKSTTIRKKNLEPTHTYYFRVRPCTSVGWDLYSSPSVAVHILPDSVKQMKSPYMKLNDSISVTITWETISDASGYQIRYRPESSVEWTEISALVQGNVVRKKNLNVGVSYVFAIKPVGTVDQWEYSLSSSPMTVATLSDFLRNLFPHTLLCKDASSVTPVETSVALSNKVIGVYFSAHWCGPCRNFTPQLANLYMQCKRANKKFEVIFCSADHSEKEFNEYYSSMPWLAINYPEDVREELMAKFKVSGIPKLTILGPAGNIIVDNAAGGGLSLEAVDSWIAQSSL